MSKYHTDSLAEADIFVIMGSIYAEVARYDSALVSSNTEMAAQAVKRAQEIIDFSQELEQLNSAQKREITVFNNVFIDKVKESKKTMLDSYLMPFAISARLRQLS